MERLCSFRRPLLFAHGIHCGWPELQAIGSKKNEARPAIMRVTEVFGLAAKRPINR
jgi:hypothetical protein